ncbi:hypothetical protein LEP1GSC016_2252 [Leptospira borgpetersenii serovar Hardjo-bovis str. Sponselee]|uniref:Uncharacterized protein n=1 Tax=Leptospira borgpetersenii serovar Hardjo-bovis str. Sponselee TaxID=1303729 RepID=M6C6X9_LEPBO|nr:hypothetical protein LEP1GSC016_2252 [Leptospira borgpetersenii serovar Hardjo-bovis str. Sponselee]
MTNLFSHISSNDIGFSTFTVLEYAKRTEIGARFETLAPYYNRETK